MTLAVVVATGLAAGRVRVRLAKYRRWRWAPVMARVPITGGPSAASISSVTK
jgi:hypothetical protein